MKNILSLTALVLFSLFYSCNSKPEEKAKTYAMSMAPIVADASVSFNSAYEQEGAPYDASDTVTGSTYQPVDKKRIIKDGEISIKSENVAASKKNIDELIKQYGSYYNSEEFENDTRAISFNLKIRIPSDNFEKFIAALENGKDEITGKSIHARDVTEEYTDLEMRLSSKRDYLKQYKSLLSKASTVKDILAIEENISALQEEIESKEGRLKYLSDQVSYSTLDIRLFKMKEYVYKPLEKDKFSERVKSSLGNGWTSVIDFVLWLITVWPGILITLVVAFLIRRFIKRRKSRKQQ